jgi:hypothetical protein
MCAQEASADYVEGEGEEESVESSENWSFTGKEIPPILQISPQKSQFTLQNADEVAELIAAAPGIPCPPACNASLASSS